VGNEEGRTSMTRQALALLAAAAALVAAVFFAAPPAGASHPSTVDAGQLALPQSSLPQGTVIDHTGVSDNADADQSQIHFVHGPKRYEDLSRVSGYRMDFHYAIQGNGIGTEYLASIFGTADEAKSAMDDAIGPLSLIGIIGTPLPHQCTAGESCKAYSGSNPLAPASAPQRVIFAVYTRGPILIETAVQAPAASFDAIEPDLETALYALLAAADTQVEKALGGNESPTAAPTTAPTAVPTDTPPTVAPAPKTPTKKCKKGQGLSHGKCAKCKKGYVVVHGKCTKKKRG